MSDIIDGMEKSPAPYANVVKGSRCGSGKSKSSANGNTNGSGAHVGTTGTAGTGVAANGDRYLNGRRLRPAVEAESLEIIDIDNPPATTRDYSYHGLGSGSKPLTPTQEYLDRQATSELATEYLNATQPRQRAAHRVREAESLFEAAIQAAAILKRAASRLAFDLQSVGESTLLEPDIDKVAKTLRDLGQFGFELIDLQRRVMVAEATKKGEVAERAGVN